MTRAPFIVASGLLVACASSTLDQSAEVAAYAADAAPHLDAGLHDAAPSLDAYVGARDDGGSKDGTVADAARSVCDGATPHGCYVAHADNPKECPAQIHEQSSGYPPLEEWTGCDAPWYVPCTYSNDGMDLVCVCDLGFHWICTY